MNPFLIVKRAKHTYHSHSHPYNIEWCVFITMRANDIATKFVEIACNNRKNKLIL